MSQTPVPTGNDIQANSHTTGVQIDPSVTALADGGFVLMWASEDQDGSGFGIFGQRYAADGAPVGVEFRANSYTTISQHDASVTGLTDGGFVVMWSSDGQDGDLRGIYGQRYAANGTPVGAEFRANNHTNDDQALSSVTALADGGFVVTWASYDQDGSSWGIYGQRYAVDGTPVGEEFRANSYTTGPQMDPSVAALADGGFVVMWASLDQDGSSWGIYGQRYSAAGTLAGSEFRINSRTTDTQTYSSVAGLLDGGFVVTWASYDQDGSEWGIYGQRYAADGSAVGAEFQANTFVPYSQYYPTVTSLEDGGFTVTWTSIGQGGVHGQRYAADGTVKGGEFQVNQIPTLDQVTTSLHSLDTLTDGRLVQVWSGWGSEEVLFRLIDVPPAKPTNVVKVGDQLAVNTATFGVQESTAIAVLTNGGFVVSWTDRAGDGSSPGDVKAQIFASDGSKVGSEFFVNTITLNDQGSPAVTGLSNGGFVVSWGDASGQGGDSSLSGVKAQAFTSDGSKVGTEFLVNTATFFTQSTSDIAGLANGNFVVTWVDWSFQGGDASSGGIKAQIFEANGTKVGAEFLVNTTTLGRQDFPVIASLANGGFVVSWEDQSGQGPDNSQSGIKAQVFTDNGTKVGAEFLVNTTTLSTQFNINISSLSDGRFVAIWVDRSGQLTTEDPASIKAQIFSATGAKIGGEITVAATTYSDTYGTIDVGALADGGFVVSWGQGTWPDHVWIEAQIFSADGSKVDDVFQVGAQGNVFIAHSPNVVGLPNGRFVANWETIDVYQQGIAAQVFDVLSNYSVAPSAAIENEGETITFTITRSGDLSAETVYASTIDGAANGYSVNSGDYPNDIKDLPVTFASGQTSATVTFAITDDSAVEADETSGFVVQLSPSDPNTTFLAKTNWNIHDNDEPGVAYWITPKPGTVSESTGSLAFTLSRSGSLDAETLYVSTVQGAANGYSINNGDYATDVNNLPISFAAGQTSQPVTVTLLNDSVSESWETFGLIAQRNGSDVPGIYLAKSSFSIQDDDGGLAAGWSISPVGTSFYETTGSRSFIVTRANASQSATVYVSTAQTEGFVNGGDYGGLANHALTFVVGETSKPLTLSITDDAMVEENETFGLVIQQSDRDPVATYLAKTTFTILDNDHSQLPLSVALSADISVAEEDGFAILTASLDRPASQTVSVFYSTIFGTASAWERDYYSVLDQKITFKPGEQTQPIKIQLLNDSSYEGTEYFDVRLTDPQGMTLGRDVARVTLLEDEATAPFFFSENSVQFMATLAKAAYFIPTGTNPNHIDKDADDLAISLHGSLKSKPGFKLLTTTDLPTLLPRPVANPDYPVLGLVDGIFVNENAAALVGTMGSALYIAFRGTNDSDESLIGDGPDHSHWIGKEDHYALFEDDADSANFLKAVGEYLKTHAEIRHVYVTGHSLGAAMAQALMTDRDGLAYSSGRNFTARTFANPGFGAGNDVWDVRIINIYNETDIIRAPASVSRTVGSHFVVHDASLQSLFSPIELHDMSLYFAIATLLSRENISLWDQSFAEYVIGLEAHKNLDITRNGTEWSVKLPGIGANFATEVRNTIFASTPVDEVFLGAVGLGLDLVQAGVYYTAHTVAPVVVDLAKGVAEGIGVGVDRLTDILSAVTGPGDDTIIGNAFGNVIEAGAGADIVLGGFGLDWLIGGSGEGDDLYDGGGDVDTVVYASTTQGIYVNLAASRNHAVGPEIGTDQIIDVENVIGGAGIDTLIGNSLANRLDGGAAADYLLGAVGNDFYRVDDTFDLVDEGGAFPTFAGSALDFDTISSTAEWFWDVYSVGERLQIEEGAVGSDGAGTTIVGSIFSNEMIGNSGTNVMFGRGGADTYRAGDGVDWISLSLLGVTEQNSYVGVDGVNTIIVDKRTTGALSYDIIFEFEVGKDKINVSSYGYATATEVIRHGHDDGFGNSYYALGDGFDYVYLVGVTLNQVQFTTFVV